MRGMKAAYSDPKFLPDEYAITVWYGLLKDIPYAAANKAVMDIIRTSPFPPTVADITKRVHQRAAEEGMSELEAWSRVRIAIRNSNYNAEKEFTRLPRPVQKAIGTAANLKELAAMDEETVESVQQSHFVRTYRAVMEQQKQEECAELPTFLQKRREELTGARQQEIEAKAEKADTIEHDEPEKDAVDLEKIEKKIEEMWLGNVEGES